MTTARHAARPVSSRQRRRLDHRRLVREEFLAVLFLAVVLLVTLLLLALQWLDSGSPLAVVGHVPMTPGGLT